MSTSSSGISFDVNEFTDKRVLVTGGTKGAGKAIAIVSSTAEQPSS